MHTTPEVFYERYVVKLLDGCWAWSGPLDKDGYAIFNIGRGRQLRVHRWVLARTLGRPIAPGLFACHTCDVPMCVRAEHIWEGTHAQNDADCNAKGRRPHGESHYAAKLTDKQVAEIRAARGESQASIARRYGVDASLISLIVNGRRRHGPTLLG